MSIRTACLQKATFAFSSVLELSSKILQISFKILKLNSKHAFETMSDSYEKSTETYTLDHMCIIRFDIGR